MTDEVVASGPADRPASKMRSDIALLYAARGVRGFGDGFAIIILPAYLTAIGYDPAQIGLVATASLLGTALLTLAIGTIAARHDLRALLLAGAFLMACTGLAFPNVEQFAFVALVAFVGTINPSTGDLGVLVPIEHAMLAHGVTDQERTRTFARYSLIGALSMAAGVAGRGGAGFPRAGRHRHGERLQADVLRLCGVGRAERPALPAPAARADGCAARQRAARAVARRGLQAVGAVQPRCVCRRVRRAVAAGAVAVRALRPVAVGGEPVLLLGEHGERVFLSGGGVAGDAHRPHQHHGLHPHPVQHPAHPGGVLAKSVS